MIHRVLRCILVTLALASGCSTTVRFDPDAGVRADASTPPDGGPPRALRVERWGERLYGPVLALSRIERELWIGTGAVVDTSEGDAAPVRSALARLDLDTGVLRVFESELPRAPHWSGGTGPTPTAGVVADGARRIAVARSGLISIEDDELTPHPLTVDGASASPMYLALDRNGERARLWVSTDLGLLELDPDALSVRTAISLADLGGMPGPLAIEPATGAVFVAAFADDGSGRVVRLLGEERVVLTPGRDGVPEGLVGDVIWSESHGGVFVALASWDARGAGVLVWDGESTRVLVDEGALSLAATGSAQPFGTSRLAYEPNAGILVVGGRIRPTSLGRLEGGGLAWVDVSDAAASRPSVVGVSTGTTAIRGDFVSAVAYDPDDRRTYVALQHPCNETRLGNVGLHSIYFESGRARLEIPILSGVRDLQRVDGELWIGMRDDSSAIACDGVQVQMGLARVDSAGGALLPELRGWDAGRSNVTQLAFGDEGRRVAVGVREDIFIDRGAGGLRLNPAIEFGTSLWPEDVLWEDAHTFWVAGRSSHREGDPASVADTGPRGAARVTLSDAGAVASVVHYVRRDRDHTAGTREGLPSAEVYDVLLDASGRVYLVCGTERMAGTYDRQARAPFRLDGELRRGGVVRIEGDGSITTIAGSGVVPDGRAAAFAPDGTLFVLDAERGLLRQTAAGFEPSQLGIVPTGSEPHTLWVGRGGDLVAGYDTGVLLRIDAQDSFLDDVGYVWNVEVEGDVIYLGTDRGLVRVTPQGAAQIAEPEPDLGERPPFASAGGECLPEGEVCDARDDDCCPGLACGGTGFVLNCLPL